MTKKKLDERHRAQAAVTKAVRSGSRKVSTTASAAKRTPAQQKAITASTGVRKATNRTQTAARKTANAISASANSPKRAVKQAVKTATDMTLGAGAVRTAKKVASNPTVKKVVSGAVDGVTLGAAKKVKKVMTASEVRNSPAFKSAQKRVSAADGKALYEEIKRKSSKRGK